MIEAPPRTMRSDYMRFAKLDTAARFVLSSSGVADCAMSDLGADIGELDLHGSNSYGYPPLVEAIADRFAVDPTCVVMAGGGASFANHLALAALLSPGDEVLIEEPTYELIVPHPGIPPSPSHTVRRKTRKPLGAGSGRGRRTHHVRNPGWSC